MSRDERMLYDDAKVCSTCKREFTDMNRKVRHHCHVTGRFLSATCNNCNLQLKPTKAMIKNQSKQIAEYVEYRKKDRFFVPVIAHNMRGYDSHLIIKNMEKRFTCENIDVIASNTEKFIAFQIGQLRFLDSLQFLNASLDALVSNLKKDEQSVDPFSITRRHFPDDDSFRRIICKRCVSVRVYGRRRQVQGNVSSVHKRLLFEIV